VLIYRFWGSQPAGDVSH